MTKWGPWIRHDGAVKPSGLQADQMIEAVFINKDGDLKTASPARPAGRHQWEGTLAYRVEQLETTHVITGSVVTAFTHERWPADTHKITYSINKDGDVLSCKMEKL
jgi:hypothetical protein